LRFFEPIDESVNVGASAGQLLPQDATELTISPSAPEPSIRSSGASSGINGASLSDDRVIGAPAAALTGAAIRPA
jgi:hypothetical protein